MSLYTNITQLKKLFEDNNLFKPAGDEEKANREEQEKATEELGHKKWQEEQEKSKAEHRKVQNTAIAKARQALRKLGLTDINLGEEDYNGINHVEGSNAEGEKVWVSFENYGKNIGKLNVRGSYPRNKKNEYITAYDSNNQRIPAPSISLSASKTVDQIAADISRRFLPAYREYLTAVNKVIANDNEYEDSTISSLEFIKGRPLDKHERATKQLSHNLNFTKDENSYLRATVKASKKSIELELHDLTPEQAKTILDSIGLIREN